MTADTRPFRWARFGGYEVSTRGDPRFSALNALMPDGRSLECHYQLDVKGYQLGGTDWRLGKGKPPLNGKTRDQLWADYLQLWHIWAHFNMPLMRELFLMVRGFGAGDILSDRFATTDINQARALALILNELCGFQ